MNSKSAVTQIQFVTDHEKFPFGRQLSTERFARDNIRFCFNEENLEHCDYCVVYGGIPAWFSLTLPKYKAIFVSPEPVNVCRYPEYFLKQFGTIITSDRDTPHPNRVFAQGGLPWHVGVYRRVNEYRRQLMTIDTFRTFAPNKHKLVSVVCSDKAFTQQHRERLAFVTRLREHFGNRLDVFGRGINNFVDKEEALAPYRYHIALENCIYKDYWTEKISDPILTLTYPIYHGCENLEDYLPSDCFTRIDITQPQQAIAIIESVISSDKDKTSQPALQHARQRILDEHNIFEVVARVVKKLQMSVPMPEESVEVTLRSRKDFKRRNKLRKAWYLLKNKYLWKKIRLIKQKYYTFLRNRIS